VLTNVQVVPGATAVARCAEVLLWFETGPQGGGMMLTQLLQAVQAVSVGSVPSHQMGAHLAAVLNTGDATAVPALVAAAPEGDGLRVVVHGWGALAADGVHLPNGWADEVVPLRSSYFLGRNTALTTAPVDVEAIDGVVAGDGLRFGVTAAPPAPAAGHTDEPSESPPSSEAPTGAAPVAWPPPTMSATAAAPLPTPWAAPDAPPPAPAPAPPAPAPPAAPPPAPPPAAPPGPAAPAPPAAQWSAGPPPLGRLVLDDGGVAVLERSCVLGSTPQASPAVQTGVAVPLTVTGPGVAGVHAEIRVEQGQVAVRDLGSATTYVLAGGAQRWAPLTPGQLTPLVPGTRIALGQRTIVYEQP